MAYNADIPQASDDPSQSQGQLLANFQELNTSNSVNHVAFNDSDQGKHKFLQMPEQGAPPTTSANEGGIYTKEQSSATELFWRNESNGGEQQLTNSVPNTSGTGRDWNFADGLQIRTGTVSHPGTATNVVFSAPFVNNVYSVVITPVGGAGTISGWNAQALTVNGFTLASVGSGGGQAFYYLAIGS